MRVTKMTGCRVVLSLLLWGLAVGASAADAEWRVDKDSDGIRVSTRAVEGWTIREIRAESQIKGRLSSLVATLVDPAASPELNEFVVESTVQNRERDTRYQLYTLTKMPWPLTDRDVLTQREIAQDSASAVVTITDTAVRNGVPEKPGLVRISRSRQQWTLTPLADGSVGVELRMLTDPNGPIPASLLNRLSISTPFKTLGKLRELAQSARYAQARLAFIKEPAEGT